VWTGFQFEGWGWEGERPGGGTPLSLHPSGAGGGQVVDSSTALGEALGVEGLGPPHDHGGSSDALPAEPAPVAVGGRGGPHVPPPPGGRGEGGGWWGSLASTLFNTAIGGDSDPWQTYEASQWGKVLRWLQACRWKGRDENEGKGWHPPSF